MPLYEQLWHARHPSLSFVGLPHSVVPFPLFEMQSAAVVSQLASTPDSIPLPSPLERLAAAEHDAASGGPDCAGRVQDTHFLGSHQWDYCRKIAKISGEYDDDAMENYIATNEALYNRASKERKGMVPRGEGLVQGDAVSTAGQGAILRNSPFGAGTSKCKSVNIAYFWFQTTWSCNDS